MNIFLIILYFLVGIGGSFESSNNFKQRIKNAYDEAAPEVQQKYKWWVDFVLKYPKISKCIIILLWPIVLTIDIFRD